MNGAVEIEIGLGLGLGKLVAACASPLLAAVTGRTGLHLWLRMGDES